MFRIDDPTAAAALPAPEAAGAEGYFTEGNPGVTQATLVRASWLNMIQEELTAIVTAAGLARSKTTYNQVLTAIKALQQSGTAKYAADTGVANTYQVAYSPAITAINDGMVLHFKAKTANTGASTFSPNDLAAAPIWGADHAALGGGEIVANGDVWVQWNSSLNGGAGAWLLIDSTGGYIKTPTPTAGDNSTKAATTAFANQTGAVVGAVRNGKMSVTAATASATFTADEIIVESSLGGAPIRLASFNKTINLATIGAGGMDTGAAPTSGYVALYAIYNPTTQTAALLAVNATSSAAPNIYGGANMPAGYAASALVSVWPTNSSGQFIAAYQDERTVYFAPTSVLANGTQTTYTSFSIAAAVPPNGKTWGGSLAINVTTSTTLVTQLSVAGSGASGGSIGAKTFQAPGNANALGSTTPVSGVPVITQQTAYYITVNPNGNAVYASNYSF